MWTSKVRCSCAHMLSAGISCPGGFLLCCPSLCSFALAQLGGFFSVLAHAHHQWCEKKLLCVDLVLPWALGVQAAGVWQQNSIGSGGVPPCGAARGPCPCADRLCHSCTSSSSTCCCHGPWSPCWPKTEMMSYAGDPKSTLWTHYPPSAQRLNVPPVHQKKYLLQKCLRGLLKLLLALFFVSLHLWSKASLVHSALSRRGKL